MEYFVITYSSSRNCRLENEEFLLYARLRIMRPSELYRGVDKEHNMFYLVKLKADLLNPKALERGHLKILCSKTGRFSEKRNLHCDYINHKIPKCTRVFCFK